MGGAGAAVAAGAAANPSQRSDSTAIRLSSELSSPPHAANSSSSEATKQKTKTSLMYLSLGLLDSQRSETIVQYKTQNANDWFQPSRMVVRTRTMQDRVASELHRPEQRMVYSGASVG